MIHLLVLGLALAVILLLLAKPISRLSELNRLILEVEEFGFERLFTKLADLFRFSRDFIEKNIESIAQETKVELFELSSRLDILEINPSMEDRVKNAYSLAIDLQDTLSKCFEQFKENNDTSDGEISFLKAESIEVIEGIESKVDEINRLIRKRNDFLKNDPIFSKLNFILKHDKRNLFEV